MSGQGNVGDSTVYQADDQRTRPDSEEKAGDRFKEGKVNSHMPQDPKDERSIANKLEREEKRKNEPEPEEFEVTQHKKDATLPARYHGNEPSKGAKIDQELREEEEAIIAKKDAQKKN